MTGFKLNKNYKKPHNYHPKNKLQLKILIEKLINERGNEADLNDIDTSEITDMSMLFIYSCFNGDISRWDVSNVIDMSGMFCCSCFNGDLSKWDVSNVVNMSSMFYDCLFTGYGGDISGWDVSNVINMRGMFYHSKFSCDLSKWKLKNNCDIKYNYGRIQIK